MAVFDDPPLDPVQFLASMTRLRQAGIIDSVVHVVGAGEGVFSWTPAYLKLLQAGREVFNEPAFQAAWATGDPLLVRAWIEREAALIPEQLPTTDGTRSRRRRGKSGRP